MDVMRNRNESAKRSDFFVGIAVILFLVFTGGLLYCLFTLDTIKGDIIDCAVVPQKDGSNRLWMLTDGSFNYISSTKTPGSYSVGSKCLFCKAWLIEYDPFSKKVIRKIKIPYGDIILSSKLFYGGDVITHISDAYHNDAPKILSYDVHTGTMVEDTAGFTSRHPLLAAGIVKARYDRDKALISLDTKDGRTNLIYSLAEKKLYPSSSQIDQERRKDMSETEKCLLCAEDGQKTRRLLYRVNAARGELLWNESHLADDCAGNMEKISSRITGARAKRISDLVFLQGIIYLQDNDGAIIIHLNQIDKKADRIMTCVDREGKVKWVVPQSGMFKQMRIDENKGYYSTFRGTENKIQVIRSQNLVVLVLDGLGIMGFDYATGKKLFTID